MGLHPGEFVRTLLDVGIRLLLAAFMLIVVLPLVLRYVSNIHLTLGQLPAPSP